MGAPTKTEFDMNEIVSSLQQFMENKARSCSMDFGCVTPEYVFRSWGGSASLKKIKEAMSEVRKMD